MRVATLRVTVVTRAGSIPTTRSTMTSSTAAQAVSSRPSQAAMTLPALTVASSPVMTLAEELGEPSGQGGGEADLAPGGPLPDPGGQGHLGGGHRVDEPDLVVHLDRAAVGQAQLVGAGVRDRDQLRPLDRVRDPLQVAGDLEQLLGSIDAPCAASSAPTAAASARIAAMRSRSWLAGHTLIIPEHAYESQSCPQSMSLQGRSFRDQRASGRAAIKGGRNGGDGTDFSDPCLEYGPPRRSPEPWQPAADQQADPAAAEGDETGDVSPRSSKAPANETTAQGARADSSRPLRIQSAVIETGPLRWRAGSATGGTSSKAQ